MLATSTATAPATLPSLASTPANAQVFACGITVQQGLVDVAMADDPTQALLVLVQVLQSGALSHWPYEVDVNTGYLSLTPAQVRRIKRSMEDAGHSTGFLFSHVPSTQQAALAQGFMVKENATLRFDALLAQQEALAAQQQASLEATALAHALTTAVKQDTASALASATPSATERASETLELDPHCAMDSQLQPSTTPLVQEEGTPAPKPAKTKKAKATAAAEKTPKAPEPHADTADTQVLRGTLRSGRVVEALGHLVVLGDVHVGAELRAAGDIVVWGELKGVAHAGCFGNEAAEIRALRLDALQLRIADKIARRPDQRLQHGATTEAQPLAEQRQNQGPANAYFPELARLHQGAIQVLTTRQQSAPSRLRSSS